MRFDKARNREEFVAKFGFDPRDLDWTPQTTLSDHRDNRDPGEIGRRILGKVKRWPSTGVCTHADRALAR